MKEIKATAPTREELYREYKRLRDRLECAESFIELVGMSELYKYNLELENKTND